MNSVNAKFSVCNAIYLRIAYRFNQISLNLIKTSNQFK